MAGADKKAAGPPASPPRLRSLKYRPWPCNPVVDWPIVLGGVVPIVGALGILFLSYGPYDGHFKDNVLFLFFMGGLFAGMAMAVFELLLLLPADTLYIAGMVLLGFPLLEQLFKLIVLNRRQHQGERTALFYGGSLGLGLATMLALFKSQREVPLVQYADLGVVLTDPGRLLAFVAIAAAVLLAHFATGIVLGDGVRTRQLARNLGLAVFAMVPVQFFVFEYTSGLRAGAESEGFVYLPLMLAYTGALAWWSHARVLPNGLPPDAQRKRRRLQRRAQREGEDAP